MILQVAEYKRKHQEYTLIVRELSVRFRKTHRLSHEAELWYEKFTVRWKAVLTYKCTIENIFTSAPLNILHPINVLYEQLSLLWTDSRKQY